MSRPRAPWPLGARGLVLAALALAGLAALVGLGLEPGGLVPREAGLARLRQFLAAALQPALDYESTDVPPGAPAFLWTVASGLLHTVAFALAGMSLALLIGFPLGLVASDSWWDRAAFGGGRLAPLRRPLQLSVRVAIALMRSVHELVWAVVFLAAMGLTAFSAVVAIAIPYGGTLAKVFSEMLDEAPREGLRGVRGTGAPPLIALLTGLVPAALPDMAAYAFYRFECATRSSAVLGFFGLPTLGYHLPLAYQDLHYREVWTYLYALLALVLLLEAWSGALRRRFVA